MYDIDIDKHVRKELNIEDLEDYSTFRSNDLRFKYYDKIKESINKKIPLIEPLHDKADEEKLKKDGVVIFENFLSIEQVNELKRITEKLEGHSFHVPNRSYKNETRVFSEDLDWPILSYQVDELITNKIILDIATNQKIVSLVQSYLGSFPTFYSVNMWWSIYTGEVTSTKLTHRDYDDYKFLAFFVYLSDIDENNGPHVYYPNTFDGTEEKEEIVITGKAGTAILADTYGLHKGQPLESGKRLILWLRFGMFLNNTYHRDKNYLYKKSEEEIFSSVEDNEINRYLLRGFLKDNS